MAVLSGGGGSDLEKRLILVDEYDREVGECGKLEAHRNGLLHRAFSVFIFRRILVDEPDGTRNFHYQLLIQKRAAGKYHSAGLWANSCCSHPGVGEVLKDAAARRLTEETGLVVPAEELDEVGAFIYKANFDNGLMEYEFDHVFVGHVDGGQVPEPDPEEAEEMRFVDVEEIIRDVRANPGEYAAWFAPALFIATERQSVE